MLLHTSSTHSDLDKWTHTGRFLSGLVGIRKTPMRHRQDGIKGKSEDQDRRDLCFLGKINIQSVCPGFKYRRNRWI